MSMYSKFKIARHKGVRTAGQWGLLAVFACLFLVMSADQAQAQYATSTASVGAYKVVCDSEADLPDWGGQGGDQLISSTTARDWVQKHKGCHWAEDTWQFQWGESNINSSYDGDYVGKVNEPDWYDFDAPSQGSQPATVEIGPDHIPNRLWFREVLQEGYLPFNSPPQKNKGDSSNTAEFYCNDDNLNYDNMEWIDVKAGEQYSCVAFNVPEEPAGICGHKYDTSGNGLEDWTINLIKPYEKCADTDLWADRVEEYTPKGEISEDRMDEEKALHEAQDDDSFSQTPNFVSLGFGGSITLEFDNVIPNGSGYDIEVFETTYGSPTCKDYPEMIHAYASRDGNNWVDLGKPDCQAGESSFEFDLGPLDQASYIKLVDETDSDDPAFAREGDGYDIDGVRALHCAESTETDASGQYCFYPEQGDYRVMEELRDSWSYVDYYYQDVEFSGSKDMTVDFTNKEASDPVCGDGEVNQEWEECDDGNTENGDGCSSECRIEKDEPEAEIGGCKYEDVNNNGQRDDSDDPVSDWPVILESCTYTELEGSDGGALDTDNYMPGAWDCRELAATTTGPEGCYSFSEKDFAEDGLVRYKISEQVRDDWTPVSPRDGSYSPEKLSTSTSYDFLNYYAYCGNGHEDPGEECDDGNTQSGDGCSSECQIEDTDGGDGENGKEDDKEDDGGGNTDQKEEQSGQGGGSTALCILRGTCGDSPATSDRSEREIVVKGEAGEPMLAIGKTVNKQTVNPADTLKVKLVITNNGDINAADVRVSDVWPGSFTSEGESTRTWELGDMAPGAIEVATHTVKVGGNVAKGPYDSPATATAANNPPVKDSVSVGVEEVEVLAASGFSITEFLILASALALLAGSAMMVRRRWV